MEFFHKDHFEHRYHRRKAKRSLAHFIDFFWETDFEKLWELYSAGFSDALFPNLGYTYLINLGTPFIMQLENERYEIRSNSFLPRNKNMICHHSTGNRIFGIKFKVSPVLLEKKVDFSEYKEFMFPLSYLIDSKVIEKLTEADSFLKRMDIMYAYYDRVIENHVGARRSVDIVTQILNDCYQQNDFSISIEDLSSRYKISSKTLQRYFEATTSISSKQALQIMRIRKAIEHLTNAPSGFHFSTYGYYDYSHFYKHLKSFINKHTIDVIEPHLKLLKRRVVNGK